MNTAELNDLELHIDSLLDNVNRLKNDNQTLRNQLAVSARERTELKAKNQRAAVKIRQIINQLKEDLS